MSEADEPVPPWYLKGELLGACNCDWGCPCNFEAAPTYGYCDGFYVVVAHEGTFGEVDLTGVRFMTGGHAPGPVHEGDGTSFLVMDETTTEEQRRAIERLWRGGGVGSPFDEFASVTTVWFEPMIAKFEVNLDGIRSGARVRGAAILELALDHVTNPVTGKDEITYLDHPTGFSSKYSELGMSAIARFESPWASFDTTGKYAEYAQISYSGP